MEAGSCGVKERVCDQEMKVEGQNMHLEVRLQKKGDWEVAKQNGRSEASSLTRRTVFIQRQRSEVPSVPISWPAG